MCSTYVKMCAKQNIEPSQDYEIHCHNSIEGRQEESQTNLNNWKVMVIQTGNRHAHWMPLQQKRH